VLRYGMLTPKDYHNDTQRKSINWKCKCPRPQQIQGWSYSYQNMWRSLKLSRSKYYIRCKCSKQTVQTKI